MEESDSSSSGSSLGQILMKYRKKVKEDRISNRLSIESLQNSNINININMPTTSGSTSFSVSLESGTSSKKQKNKTVPKETRRKNNKKSKNKMSKPNTPSSNNQKSSEQQRNETDPDYAPKSRHNYSKLTQKELSSIASRVQIFHETGFVLSDEEDVIPCQNKNKRKKKNGNEPKQRGPEVCGTMFGQGRVGTTFSRFGVRRCGCCNVNKDSCSRNLFERQTPVCFSDMMEGMSEHMRNQLKQREERFLQVQQRDLLKHPELIDSDDSEVIASVPPAELSQDKREWVQKFIDSMSVDRVDYEKPKQLNIVEGISHKRPSDVNFKNEEQLADSLDAKTIVQRVDFRKEDEKRQSKIDEWLRSKSLGRFHTNQLNATSTPQLAKLCRYEKIKSSSIPTVNLESKTICTNEIPSTSTAQFTGNDALEDCSLRTSEILEDANFLTSTRIGSILDEYSSDFSHLDRSNVTIRTPQSKLMKEAGLPSVPSHSKTKDPVSQNKEKDLMSYVDTIMAAEEESIKQEAHELCEKYLKTTENTRNVLQDALDEVLITSDNSPDRYDHVIDNSIEIIDPPFDIGNNNFMVVNDSVQLIESDEEAIPIINLIDSFDTPSTSRPIRAATRRRRYVESSPLPATKKMKNKKKNGTKLPPIAELAPPTACTEPVTLGTAENKSSARSLRDCPICLESLEGKEISSTICGHVFCTPCITAAVRAKRACPNCRTSLSLKKIHPLFI